MRADPEGERLDAFEVVAAAPLPALGLATTVAKLSLDLALSDLSS